MHTLRVKATVAVLAILLSHQSVNAEVHFSIINSKLTTETGTVTIALENDIPVAGIQLDLNDTENLLAVDTIRISDRAETWKAHYIELPNGDLRVLAFVDTEVSTVPTQIDSGSGDLFEVDFTKTEETSVDSIALSFAEIILSDMSGNGIEGEGTGGYMVDLTTGTPDDITELPLNFELNQNYPNPFNASTNIPFALPKATSVKLTIYNLLGQEVKTFRLGELQPGVHSVRWDGTSASGLHVESGMYFYQVIAGNFVQTKKMVLLK